MGNWALAIVGAAVLAMGLGGAARADNSVCLSSGGDWRATGTIKSAGFMMGGYSIDFTEAVKGERLVPPTAMSPLVPGDCLVISAGGLGDVPEGCKQGGTATVTGRLSFDGSMAMVNIARSADISCQ